MGAELGATCSVFPYDDRMAAYLRATSRGEIASLCDSMRGALVADPECAERPEVYYDRVVEIDLSALEPHVVGPGTPDLARPISAMREAVAKEGYPAALSAALIGSCTNSSYEDIDRSAHLARQAASAGIRAKVPLLVSPGSDQVFATIQRDGQMAALHDIGATVLANACGPCIGQWKRDDVASGQQNSIVNSFNRNFPARNDGNTATLSFIASPEIVTALALAGDLAFDPTRESIEREGISLRLQPPVGDELPRNGFAPGFDGFIAPADGSDVHVAIAEGSSRLQKLSPFAAWDGKDPSGLVVLLKAKGKCTTDHISAAGAWLKFRGHLENICGNLFLTATNAFTGAMGKGRDVLAGEDGVAFPDLAKRYRAAGQKWIAVGDENYGEGSSREHAAMEPRFMGCVAVVARSFARIHETNLKKQGVLPLTFADPADYEKVAVEDRVTLEGVAGIPAGKAPTLVLAHADGSSDRVALKTTISPEQFKWFVAGSALNQIRGG
jgi:aconitate hydratase